MTTLSAEAQVRLSSPARYLGELCEHFEGHDLPVSRTPEAGRIAFAAGTGTIEAGSARLVLRAEAADLASLATVKHLLASHLEEHARAERPEIVWTGDGSDLLVPPNFREMRVAGVRDVGPHMRRVTLAGEDLGRFDAFDIHVKLLIPPAGQERPEWPVLGRNGCPVWPEPPGRPAVRTYTMRRIDVAAGEIDVDFVVHEDAGPGSAFALKAAPGDVVGMMGPGGRSAGEADWYLLAGDETAIPAIGRILERLPGHARGVALIETADEAGRMELATRSSVELRWLFRDRAAGSPLLADAVREVGIPAGERVFAWSGAEFEAFRAIRAHWRGTCGLTKEQHLAVAYWRRGWAEGETPRSRA